MPLPDFTSDERYLINFLKSSSASQNSYMWGYLIGGAVIAGFGVYHGSALMILNALVLVYGFRVYEEYHQSKWIPKWRSIIAKYEAALGGDEGHVESKEEPDS